MPANLPPQYQKAEREFRRAQTPADQEACLINLLQLLPRHKGTEKLQAELRTRLKEVRIRKQLDAASAAKTHNFARFPRQGAARIVIIGPPNSGKSRILRELTRATPEVSPWPFTTRDASPGMMIRHHVAVQLIDTPPIAADHPEPWLLNLIRTADLVLLAVRGSDDDAVPETMRVLQELCLRKTKLGTENGFDESDFSILHLKSRILVTESEAVECELRIEMLGDLLRNDSDYSPLWPTLLRVELDDPNSVSELGDTLYSLLNIIRVYTRRPGSRETDSDPVTIPVGGTVEDLALELHEELFQRVTHARIWRAGGQDGQTVGRTFSLQDEDIVELHC